MTDDAALPVAGWYDDPDMALRLRWWDGTRWSQHTRPKPITENAPAAANVTGQGVAGGIDSTPGGIDSANTSTIAAPANEEPYSYSVPYSATPASAPRRGASSAPGSATGAPSPQASTTQLGTFGARQASHRDLWNTMGEHMDYAPERTTTTSAWMLAATPLVAFGAQLAVTILTGLESTPWVLLLAAGLLPIMWIIVFVRRDRMKLHDWGHLERASAWWALLGSYGYLAARGIIVQRQAGRGWWPLVVTILLTAVLVALGVYSPALFLVLMTPVT